MLILNDQTGPKLRVIRQQRNISIKEMARRLKVSIDDLTRIEFGREPIRVEFVEVYLRKVKEERGK